MGESTADHLARHHRLIAQLQAAGVHPDIARDLYDRTLPGFQHHGEHHHHREDFRPLHEADAELCDFIDLGFVFPRERLRLGIAEPLPTPEAQRLYADCQRLAVQLANKWRRLLRVTDNER